MTYKPAPTLLGSSNADWKTHQAWSSAMRRIYRAKQLGSAPSFNREHDKPAMLGTARSASDTPREPESDVRFAPNDGAPAPFWSAGAVIIAALALATIAALVLL